MTVPRFDRIYLEVFKMSGLFTKSNLTVVALTLATLWAVKKFAPTVGAQL